MKTDAVDSNKRVTMFNPWTPYVALSNTNVTVLQICNFNSNSFVVLCSPLDNTVL